MDQRTISILERQRRDLVVRVLKKHEEAEAGRLLTERILSGIGEFFLLFDQDFRLARSNRPLGAKEGAKDDTRDAATPESLFGPETGAEIRRRLSAEDLADFEARLMLEDGPAPVRVRPLRHAGPDGRALYILLCSDLRELNRLGAQLREGQRQLVHSSRLASLGEMAAGIGHELTQPLGAILLLAQNALKMLDDPRRAAAVRDNLEMIVDRADKAAAIINTMRGLGRKVEGALAPVDVGALLRKLMRFLSGQFRLHDIELDLDLPDGPLPVLAVEVRLEQVFLNLAQNAVQALGDAAAPRLRVAARLEERLDVRTMRNQTCVAVDLRDNGPGMDEALQAKIFDPFFTTRAAGMGLGLSLVDRMVREFSGFVAVESRPGEGSCFSVWLPLYREGDGAPPAATAGTNNAEATA